jgi:uncharacterized protein
MKFVGRSDELVLLRKEFEASRSSFVAVYGRRRIGKTELIEHFITSISNPTFGITAAYNASSKAHFENFADKLKLTFALSLTTTITSWTEAFGMLRDSIITVQTINKAKFIVFIDELPWFAGAAKEFKSALSLFWNDFAAKRDDIMLVVCGSLSSWIVEHVIEDRGSLANRLTALIHLQPFNLAQTKVFLVESGHAGICDNAVLEYSMIFGGVAYYLTLLDGKESFVQNIQRLFFSQNGLLRDEYFKLFRSLFDNFRVHELAINHLSQVWSGMTKSELAKRSGLQLGSVLDNAIKELEASALISSTAKYNQKSREVVYRVCDTFVFFAHKWVNPVSSVELSQNKNYFYALYKSQPFRIWCGFAFEAICHAHISQIKHALGISGVRTSSYYWSCKPKESLENGAQIDLLIDRDDGIINIIECKFYASEFVIDKKYAQELQNKEIVFNQNTKNKKTINIVMITSNGVRQNSYYDEILTGQILASRLLLEA